MTVHQVLNDTLLPEPDLPLSVRLTTQPDLLPHMHTFIELVMVVAGSGTHIFKTERYPITVGDVFVIPPFTLHGYDDTDELVIYNILFKEQLLARFRTDLELLPGFHGLLYLEPYYRSVRGHLKRELQGTREGRRIMVETVFVELLLFYCRRFSQDPGPASRVMPVAKVIGYMNAHYADPLTLDTLAEVAGLSKRSLIRHFKNTTGTPPMRYLQAVRIAKARTLLTNEDVTVTEVAIRVGFNDPAYFATLFKRYTGLSPSHYRHSNRAPT